MKQIGKIDKIVSFYWDEQSKAVISEWEHFFVDENEFLPVIEKVLLYAKKNFAKAWIVNATASTSVFKKEIFEIIKTQIITKLVGIGVQYFVTIKPITSAFAQITEQQYKNEIKKHNIKSYEARNLSDALNFLNQAEKNINT